MQTLNASETNISNSYFSMHYYVAIFWGVDGDVELASGLIDVQPKHKDIRLTIGFVVSLAKQINKVSSAPHALFLLLHQTWRSAWSRKHAHEVNVEVKYELSEHGGYFEILTTRWLI